MSLPNYDITAAAVIGHGVLRLTFADGTSGEVDVLCRMRGPVFERARTPEGFREAHIAEGTVAWPAAPTSRPTPCTSASTPAPGHSARSRLSNNTPTPSDLHSGRSGALAASPDAEDGNCAPRCVRIFPRRP